MPYDLNKAFNYFDQAISSKGPWGYYNRGYMNYKGFGCVQNYDAAFDDFRNCALFDEPRCMYMLGLCYRNGFGTVRNEDMANTWLKKAAANGFIDAEKELSLLTELDPVVAKLLQDTKNAALLQNADYKVNEFNEVTDIVELLSSTYHEGYWIKYDWSGKHILSVCLLYTSPSPRDRTRSRMPSSA